MTFGSPASYLLAALLGSLVSGCGGGSSGNNNNPPPPPPPPTVGLDARPSNLSCVAPARATLGTIDVTNAFPGLDLLSVPTKILVEPVANPRWFALEKNGRVVTFDPDNAVSLTPFLDLTGTASTSANEGGLLGMAFHPDYPDVPEVFLSYTVEGTGGEALHSIVTRFILDDINSPGAGTVPQQIIEIDQFAGNHNGGEIAFGPDGLLYFGLGDGGGGGDPNETAQDTTNLLGSMLRIDVIGTGEGYNIPGDNPFAARAKCGPTESNADDCPEIYAWGLRNPWRFSFDQPSGDLWAADVGQNAWEEIDLILGGRNYGWDCREGAHDFEPAGCSGPFEEPVSEYPNSGGNGSITGGFVYRGTNIPGLFGRYVFADFVSGRIWALQSDGMDGYTNEELINTSTGPSSFGVDQDGELYYTDINSGRIMQLIQSGGGVDQVPDLLSASGCVDPGNITMPYDGLVPYDINAPFWSDGADKERFIGIPDGTAISIDAEDDWEFPAGTVLVKNFRLNGQLIETRHLMHHPDGVWAGYTYEWDASETEATRVRGGKVSNINGQDWIFPDEAECLGCHTAAAGIALGPETSQMNRDFTYPQTGRTHGQLETLDAVAMFASPLQGSSATLPAMPDPMDTGAALDERARAYLHTNCAQCHRPGGPTPANVDLRYTIPTGNMNACDVDPEEGDLGLTMAKIIVPGDASRSVLVERMNRRDPVGMPPLGSGIVDADGVTLVTDWINSLLNCN
jgi:uncharacterized repeat protein (TIGR03806 family)